MTRIMLTSTYVYVCVFVNIHIFRNMCMGANIYKKYMDSVYFSRFLLNSVFQCLIEILL